MKFDREFDLTEFKAGKMVCLLGFDKKYGRIQSEDFLYPKYVDEHIKLMKNLDHNYRFCVVKTPEEYDEYIARDKELYERECVANPEMREKGYVIAKHETHVTTAEKVGRGILSGTILFGEIVKIAFGLGVIFFFLSLIMKM